MITIKQIIGTGAGTETRAVAEMRTVMGTGMGSETGREREREREWRGRERGKGGGGELSYPTHQARRKVEDQVQTFRTRHHLCRQEVARAGSQQLLAQDPAPGRRCGTEGRTGH